MVLMKNMEVTLLFMRGTTVYISNDTVVYCDEEKTRFQNTPGHYETRHLTLRKEVFQILYSLGLHVAPNQEYIDSYISAAKTFFGADEVKDLRPIGEENI